MSQVNALWRPLFGYINTDDIQQTAVDDDAVTTVIKDTDTFATDLTNSFEGSFLFLVTFTSRLNSA